MSRLEGLPEVERARRSPPRGWRPSNALIGFLFLLVAIVGPYLAFINRIPFTSRGYQLSAVFENSVDLVDGTPVRIAGVTIGEVIGTESVGDNGEVTFTVTEEGRPVHADATAKIRPRMFLEGSWFIELEPGSPSAPEMESEDVIPVTRTATGVQLDEILTALQRPVREDLGDLLSGYGTGLNHRPTPAEDRTQDPRVHGKTGAEALNLAFEHGATAGRGSAQVAEAFRGSESRDLRRLIAAAGPAFQAFADREEQLKALVSNYNDFVGALAAESANLAATFRELDPTLAEATVALRNLNESLPALRGWALAMEPALRELPATIAAAGPWLDEAGPAVSASEGGRLARTLKRAMPGLTGAAKAGIGTIVESSLLSRCTSDVLVPTGDQVIADSFSTGEPNYKEFFYATVNLAGEGQGFDGNGPYLRIQPGGGHISAKAPNPGGFTGGTGGAGLRGPNSPVWTWASAPLLGVQPQVRDKPPFRPDVPCHTNAVPDLNAGPGTAGPPSPTPSPLP